MKKKKSSVKSLTSNNHSSFLESNTSESLLNAISSKQHNELLGYYKNKSLRLEKEFDDLSDLLDNVKSACDLSAGLQTELNVRTEEIYRLQQVVSDLQIQLYREREQSLKLSAENDQFRIREFENRKKIDVLLSLSGTTQKELMYFISVHPEALVVPQKLPPKLQKFRGSVKSRGQDISNINTKEVPDDEVSTDPQVLILKNQSLAGQLEHHINISREQIQALLKDRELSIEERQVERLRLQRDIENLSSKLKKKKLGLLTGMQLLDLCHKMLQTQDNLCEATAKLVKCQQDFEREKNIWAEDKDKYIKVITSLREKHDELPREIISQSASIVGIPRTRNCGGNEMLKQQLAEKEQLATMYHEHVALLEGEVNRLKEKSETYRNLFKEKTQKMSAQVSYLRNKYEDLDRRRLLEAEGFRTDIRMLRERLKELEKKLTKGGSSSYIQPAEQQLLTSARNTLNRARQLEKELTNIKSKIATLEVNDDTPTVCHGARYQGTNCQQHKVPMGAMQGHTDFYATRQTASRTFSRGDIHQ